MFALDSPDSSYKSMHCPIKNVCVWTDKACFSVCVETAVRGGGGESLGLRAQESTRLFPTAEKMPQIQLEGR